MFFKKQNDLTNVGEFIKIVDQVWTKVEYICIETIDGGFERYKDAEFRILGDRLIIDNCEIHIFYNLNHVIKYYFEIVNPPH